MTCNHCGSTIADNSKFCTTCGKTVTANTVVTTGQHICNHCGAIIANNSKFCMSCGNAVGTMQSSTMYGTQQNEYVSPNYQQMAYGIACPQCGSNKLQAISDVQGKGVSFWKLCLCGELGLCGSGKTKTTHYWVCQTCGNKFKM